MKKDTAQTSFGLVEPKFNPKADDEIVGFDRLRIQELASQVISNGSFRWCRARLLAALSTASNQDILRDVLEELLPDDETLTDRIVAALNSQGWSAGVKSACVSGYPRCRKPEGE